METIKIAPSGIYRNADDGLSNDGQAVSLTNLRLKDSLLQPIPQPAEVAKLPSEVAEASKIYFHEKADRYIAVTDTGVYAFSSSVFQPIVGGIMGEKTFDSLIKLDDALTGTTRVEFLGNLASFFVSGKILHALFNGTTYQYLGSLPELPALTVAPVDDSLGEGHGMMYLVENSEAQYYNQRKSNSISASQMQQVGAAALFTKLTRTLNRKGYYAGGTQYLIRYAYRLNNDEYAGHSPVLLLNLIRFANITDHRNPQNDTPETFGISTGQYFYGVNATPYDDDLIRCFAVGQKLQYAISPTDSLAMWASLITSIDVFIHPITNWHEESYSDSIGTDETAKVLSLRDNKDIRQDIADAYQFYKVAEFDLKGNLTFSLEDVSLDNLMLQDKLSDDSFTHNDEYGSVSYVFNSRLHVANLTETLYKGYPASYFADTLTDALMTGKAYHPEDVDVYIHIAADSGESIVKQTWTDWPFAPYAPPYVGYPDSRATQMDFICKPSIGSVRHIYTVPLKKHKYLNLAHYYDTADTSAAWAPLNLTFMNSSSQIDIQEQNTAITRPSVLKVSSLDNPLLFPAAQTYQPNQSNIIGLASNVAALSQGQYGQHPLYVFTAAGIYALSVGTGGVAYADANPVSRDVCINPSSITPVDQAVVFATRQGLKIIQGTQTTLLSAALEGNAERLEYESSTGYSLNRDDSQYGLIAFLEQASVAYNYREEELILAGPVSSMELSAYVYSFKSGQWSKYAHPVGFFVHRYPGCYMVTGGSMYDIQNDKTSYANVLYVSRPVKFGSLSHKRITQMAARGNFLLPEEGTLTVTVFGSNDGNRFQIVSSRRILADRRDVILRMNSSHAYKYFVLHMEGALTTDSRINYFELTARETFDNRIR